MKYVKRDEDQLVFLDSNGKQLPTDDDGRILLTPEMSSNTALLLEASIEAWILKKEIFIDVYKRDGRIAKNISGSANCPLCMKFFLENYCLGCPVALKVNNRECVRTPYAHFHSVKIDLASRERITENDFSYFVGTIDAEIAFLQSLRK